MSSQGVDAAEAALTQDLQLFTMDDDFDAHYGLLAPEQTVIVRAYSDDSDDQVLQEIKPRFIVMYEPNLEFIRRIEVRLRCSLGASWSGLTCSSHTGISELEPGLGSTGVLYDVQAELRGGQVSHRASP